MKTLEQRKELHKKIWDIANKVRGAIDGWDFKTYILGILFYRFISENFIKYIERYGEGSKKYELLNDSAINDEIKEIAIKEKGYFIYPSELFQNVVKNCDKEEDLNIRLREIFKNIENSANGYPSEKKIKGLFSDFDTSSSKLGNTVKEKNQKLAAVLKGIASIDFGDENEIDVFGDAYEYIISQYAANAGKRGGEFFTPQQVSKLLAKLATFNLESINKVYDPACGSGSLLIRTKREAGDRIEAGFYGQEINHTTYNLARMNMFLHDINYDKFNIELGDTLTEPKLKEEIPFDVIVSNPPYSLNWIGEDDPTLINDPRFSQVGVLPPKKYADFAFILHSLHYLSSKGKAAIVVFPGILYRSGAEKKIRKFLVENNYIDTIISLPENLFFGTSIATNIMILSKNKKNNNTLFINAEEFYKKSTNNNIITDEHINEIMDIYKNRKEIKYISILVDIDEVKENDYNLSVNNYIESKENIDKIDIKKLNDEINSTVQNIDKLRQEIDKLINKIENNNNKG